MGSNNQLGARIVMSNKNFEDAKAVFDKYDGSYYQMVRDGQYEKYKRYCVPKSLEKEWLKSKQNAEYKELLRSKKMYKTAHAFDMYCHFTSLLGDKNGIRIAEEYISDNMTIQDTWTLIREISTYTDLLRAFKAFDHKKKAKIIKFLKELKFEDTEGMLEMYPELFMNFPKKFEEKILKLKEELGDNYIEIIENDMSILEKII